MEPLTIEDDRDTFLPIPPERQIIYDHYKKQQRAFWNVNDESMSDDRIHYEEGLIYPNTNNENEKDINGKAKKLIKYVLSFFNISDIIVCENLEKNFLQEFKWLEVQTCYNWQASMEFIHAESYSLMINNLIMDISERNEVNNTIKNDECIQYKKSWVEKYMDRDVPLSKRLIAFLCVEGIFFSASFAVIYWINTFNRLPGIVGYNNLIAKDEGMHCEFAALLYGFIQNKLTEKEIKDIVESAVSIESYFVESIIDDMPGMTVRGMKQYVRYVADHLLNMLGVSPLYNANNPFIFTHKMGSGLKISFFEKKETNYEKSLNKNADDMSFSMIGDY